MEVPLVPPPFPFFVNTELSLLLIPNPLTSTILIPSIFSIGFTLSLIMSGNLLTMSNLTFMSTCSEVKVFAASLSFFKPSASAKRLTLSAVASALATISFALEESVAAIFSASAAIVVANDFSSASRLDFNNAIDFSLSALANSLAVLICSSAVAAFASDSLVLKALSALSFCFLKSSICWLEFGLEFSGPLFGWTILAF